MRSTWNPIRHAGIALAAGGLVVVMTGLVPASANASSGNLGDLRAQAASIAQQINTLGNQEETLSEQYDQALIQLKAAQGRVAAARSDVETANAKAGEATKVLRTVAISAYVDGGSSTTSSSAGAPSVASAQSSLLRTEYEQSLASTQSNAEDLYKLASKQATTAEGNLKIAEGDAAKTVTTLADDKASINATVKQLTAVEASDQGQIATLVTQDRIAAEKAAEAAYQQKLAEEETQATATTQPPVTQPTVTPPPATTPPVSGGTNPPGTTSPTTQPASPTTTAPSAPSGGETAAAATAVSAAESQVGVPYVWGGASPSQGFDCSGLVMWSYAQAGISLPHFSGAQYDDTTHIPLDLQTMLPGDLVFPADPGEHVAMYIGNGNIVQAPYTGADVQIIPISSFFVLASRVS